jgi:hypothetical protein
MFELTTYRRVGFAACVTVAQLSRDTVLERIKIRVSTCRVLMTTGNPLEPAFGRLLARQAGTGADTPAVAAAARRLCEDFAQHLTPLIGDGGVAAIYGRSLQLAERRFPGLASANASGQDGEPFTQVQHFLERQDPVVAAKAAVTVLAMASEVLASFIGEPLTRLLLHETWPDQFDRMTPEPAT